jgi:hypothetical protein
MPPVTFRRTQVNSVAEARQQLSSMRKELHIHRTAMQHLLDSFKHPLTIDFLHRTIASDPAYAERLLELSKTLASPVRDHIESIVEEAKQKYPSNQQEQ